MSDLSDVLMDRSALALVDGQLWDMHRPLESDCTLQLLHFHSEDPFHANRAFWRSCSFILGAVLEEVFTEDVFVELHSFPAPNGIAVSLKMTNGTDANFKIFSFAVASGSFVHDVDLKMPGWEPTREELMTLSAAMHRFSLV